MIGSPVKSCFTIVKVEWLDTFHYVIPEDTYEKHFALSIVLHIFKHFCNMQRQKRANIC